MSKMIQVRNVPDEVHRTLKLRATAKGMSLSDYIKRGFGAGRVQPDAGGSTRGSNPGAVELESAGVAAGEVREA